MYTFIVLLFLTRHRCSLTRLKRVCSVKLSVTPSSYFKFFATRCVPKYSHTGDSKLCFIVFIKWG